jgi:hypothetical protein
MYEHGSWEGALIRFRDAGASEAQLRSRQRVRYLAYRGLTHWHLGQKEEARLYLGRAQEALAERDADVTWLPAPVREELKRASLEVGVGSAPPAQAAPPPPADTPPAAPPAAPPPDDGTTPPAPVDGAPPPAVTPPASSGAPPPTVGSPSPPGAAPGAPLPPAASPPPADAL